MKKLLVASIALAIVASAVYADDIYPPFWRGQDNTTFQMWEFSNDNSPADLELGWHNPYGTPSAEVYDIFHTSGWLTSYQTSMGTEYGIWKIGAINNISLNIPNTDNTASSSYKQIWLQITYYDPYGYGDTLPIDVDPDFATLERVNSIQLESGFYHDTYLITVVPNPTSETIYITPIQCQLYIDEIVVDTICVPEPATMAIFIISSAMLIKRKK